MQPAGDFGAHLEVDTLSIKALIDVRQAAFNDADCLLELHARAQRACRNEAGQRAERLPVQPGALLAIVQPLQVGLQLCNEPVLAILTCQQNMCKASRKDKYNLCPNVTARLWNPLCSLLNPWWKVLHVACPDLDHHELDINAISAETAFCSPACCSANVSPSHSCSIVASSQ